MLSPDLRADTSPKARRSEVNSLQAPLWQRWLLSPITYPLVLLVCDFLLLMAAFQIMGLIRLNMLGIQGPEVVAAVLCLFAAFWVIDGYEPFRDKLSLGYAAEHLIATGFGLVATIFVVYVVAMLGPEQYPSRAVLAGVGVLTGLSSLWVRRVLYSAIQDRIRERVLVVIGSAEEIGHFAELCDKAEFKRSLVGFEVEGESPLGREAEWILERLHATVRSHAGDGWSPMRFEGVLLLKNPDHFGEKSLAALAQLHARHIPVYNYQTYCEMRLKRTPLSHFGDDWFLSTSMDVARVGAYANVKRAADVVMALALLIVFSPVILVVSALIKLADGGPIFFTQERIGLNQVPFTAYKFRSMREGSEKDAQLTVKADDRVTRVGKLMRPTRIDEIPQLFNVLRGDMSLIGPRPEWSKHAHDYASKIPFYEVRHLVRPGLTGWAQVNYPYGATLGDAREKLSFDLYYIKRHSFLLDVQIILKTIHLMLAAKGR